MSAEALAPSPRPSPPRGGEGEGSAPSPPLGGEGRGEGAAAPELAGPAIRARIDALAAITAEPGRVTRLVFTPEHRRAHDLVAGWMRAAGMAVREDAIGNVLGRYEGIVPDAPALLLGSHLDSVRDAGRWDGPLGVVAAIAGVDALHRAGRRLRCAVEVAGFCDEEGARFGATMLGSRALAGTFDPAMVGLCDADGITMGEAMRIFGLDPARIGEAARQSEDVEGYLELHIEQGPVLEAEGLTVGCVTAIAGATRLRVTLAGEAGHAGTVPMRGRHDALAAAAACILAIESRAGDEADAVATIGQLEVAPGAVNVIPGGVAFTLDVRAPNDTQRRRLLADIQAAIATLCGLRGVRAGIELTHELAAAACAPWLMRRIDAAIAAEGHPPRRLPSGAGHDGMALRDLCDIGMVFVRCAGGISHNPAESVSDLDAEAGARVLLRVLEGFAAA